MRTAVAPPRILRPAIAAVLGLAAALVVPHGGTVHAQPAPQGKWATRTETMPINPVHLALLHDGNVLIVSGSGNVATETTFRAALWNRQFGTISTQLLNWDMFCNGMVILPDGRPFVVGGNQFYDPFYGERRSTAYDLATGLFTDQQPMAHGRWYPGVVTLGDGRVMTFSGTRDQAAGGGTNSTVEIYTPGVGWSPEYSAGWTPPLYPRMHVVPDGRVFYSGSGTGSRFFNPATKAWTGIVATSSASRNYGTSVLLPLSPADGYRARVMVLGGGNPPLKTMEIIDLSASTPQWQRGPDMSQARIQLNATILPNGRVLVMGGSSVNNDETTASLNADLFDPATNSFTPASANKIPRVYHSGSLLLPDATVMLAGGNWTRGVYQPSIEIYSPAYLFNADGMLAARPVIGPTPDAIGYGQGFQIQTTDAGSIQSIVLARAGSQTHAFDMDQRLVKMSFTTGSDVLNVTAPPNGNIAPPGYYMLFILNAAGVPSQAKFVMVSGSGNQAPTATIVTPASNATVNPGASVTFAGTGSDPDGTVTGYSWTFPTGTPGSSTEANPTVTFSTPGTQTVSFQVTDNNGAISQPVTRSVTVANFSLSATPNSQTILAGGSTSYTVTVAPQNGFTGTVDFAVTGIPTGATATFSPASVTGSGATTLGVTTDTSIQAGTYPLVITGTSGPATRTANVTLVLSGPVNQVPTATIVTPASNVTINPGGSVAFVGTGSDSDGTINGYSWTFPTGNPASSTQANPTVTFSTPGTQTVSFQVTDDGGATSQPVTRSVTVANFSLSSAPASQAIAPGGAASYSVTVSPQNGFTGTVSFAISGLPGAATATFGPATVTGSGATTLGISTTTAIPAGTYPLVITGTSGPVTRTVNVTLVVNGDFTISAAPTPVTINRDGTATYSVAISSSGFAGTVLFSVSGLPKFATGKFTPTSVVNAGNTVLAVSTNKKVSAGTYTLTITGSSGTLVHSVPVTLVIR